MFNNTSIKPQIDSTNLIIIEDRMKQEMLAAKKSELYASYFQDPALRSCAQQIANHHKNNIDGLLMYLNSHK